MKIPYLTTVFLAAVVNLQAQFLPMGSMFTYQGRLMSEGVPANGSYEFQFSLWGRIPDGFTHDFKEFQVGDYVTNSPVAVSNGLFSAQLDFGREALAPMDKDYGRWLQIAVRPYPVPPRTAFTVLNPKQLITSAPYSLFAVAADSLIGGAEQTFTGAVHFNPPSGPAFTVGTADVVPNLDSDLFDGHHAGDFVLNTGDQSIAGSLTVSPPGCLLFGAQTRQMIDLWNGTFGIGVQSHTLYQRSEDNFAWYKGGAHQDDEFNPGGGVNLMRLDTHGELHLGEGDYAGLSLQSRSTPGYTPNPMGGERWSVYANEGVFRIWSNNDKFTLDKDGNCWMANNASVATLTIRGGADVAEPFPITGREIPKGSVVIIDDQRPGQLKLSERAYDTRVAGIVSGANGVNPGLVLHQEGVFDQGRHVALSGRVYARSDASNGPIRPGDLMTTSEVPGYAMKVTDSSKAQGAILGKAMSALEEGRGFVLVLVTLQ